MSDIFFTDAAEAPVPPDEVRFRELTAQPRPDGVRVKVRAALTPFQRRPNVEVAITNAEGRELAAVSLVEAIDPIMEFTMHLRQARIPGRYTLSARVFYADVEAQQTGAANETSAGDLLHKAKMVVDERSVEFDVAGN